MFYAFMEHMISEHYLLQKMHWKHC